MTQENLVAPILTAVALGFAVNVALSPLLLKLAHRYRWYDQGRGVKRKLHDHAVPQVGGVGIFAAFAFSGLVVFFFFHYSDHGRTFSAWYYGSILLGAGLMHLLGVIDDFSNIRAIKKFILQVMIALVVITGGTVVRSVALPFLGFCLGLGPLGVPVTVLWIVGIANAVNFIDGLDGFAASVTLFAAFVLGVGGALAGSTLTALVSFSLVGAVAGFLVFNLPPAKAFMGDGGSLFVGYVIAVIAIMTNGPHRASLDILPPLMVLTIPIMDITWAVVRRLRRGLPIHQADREHFHHKLLEFTGCPRRALVLTVAISSLLLVAASIKLMINGPIAVLLWLAVVAFLVHLQIRFGSAHKQTAAAGQHQTVSGRAVTYGKATAATAPTAEHAGAPAEATAGAPTTEQIAGRGEQIAGAPGGAGLPAASRTGLTNPPRGRDAD